MRAARARLRWTRRAFVGALAAAWLPARPPRATPRLALRASNLGPAPWAG